jgi:hypothetical protein
MVGITMTNIHKTAEKFPQEQFKGNTTVCAVTNL